MHGASSSVRAAAFRFYYHVWEYFGLEFIPDLTSLSVECMAFPLYNKDAIGYWVLRWGYCTDASMVLS